MAIFFALIAFLSWGVADLYAAISSRKIGNFYTYIIVQLVGIAYSLILLPFFAGRFDLYYFFIAFLLAIIDNVGFLFFYKAFESGNVSLNGTIAGSFGLVTVLVALLFFGEILTPFSSLGIIFISIGIILSSLRLKELLKGNLKGVFSDKGVFYAMITMLLWGVYLSLIKIPIEEIGWYWTMVPVSLMLPFLLLLGRFRKGVLEVMQNKINIKSGIIHAVFAFGGYIAYYLGIGQGNISLVGPIAGASPVLFVVLSRFVFRDRLNTQQWIGILLTLGGIVLISLS
ncbi:DMT family transporter [Candidatus Gottesmanbacteria bacterium]|nr:DMT family transporter [Candidatus Gottesmanbacteria bacterium]